MNNNIQIILQVLPISNANNSNHDLIKISENYVILSSIPKSLIFQFDQVLNANINQALYEDYFYNYIPNSTLHELLKGNDTSIIIYNDDNTKQTIKDSFDMKLVEAFSALLESNLNQLEIYISFFEFDQNNHVSQRDLISSISNQTIEYEIRTVDQLKRYYLLGLNHRKMGQLSVFSIIFKMDDQEHKINIIDITNDSTDILNQISDYLYFSPKSVIEKSPLLQILDQSQSLYFISSLELTNPLSQIQQRLSFTSNIYQRLKKKAGSLPNAVKSALPPPNHDDIHYLKQVISRLSNEVHSLRQQHYDMGRSSSVTSSSYHGSVFSSASTNSTQMTTLPSQSIFEQEKAEEWIDYHQQQIQDLDRELITARQELAEMRTVNLDLWSINDKQSEMIIKLEAELTQVQQEQEVRMNELFSSMHELGEGKKKLLYELDALQHEDQYGKLRQLIATKNKQLSHIQQQLELTERKNRHHSSTSSVISDPGKLMFWLQNKLEYPHEHRSEIMQTFATMADKLNQLSLSVSDLQETSSLSCLMKEKQSIQQDISHITGLLQDDEFPTSNIPLEQYYASLKQYQDKLDATENEMRAQQYIFESQVYNTTQDNKNLLDRITKLNNDLETEKKNNQKLSRTNHVLEKRIDDLIANKKNKIFCF